MLAVVAYWNDCDGSCWAGGGGAMLSPVVRVGYAGRSVSAALFARSLVVWNRIRRANHESYPLLLGVDLALRKG